MKSKSAAAVRDNLLYQKIAELIEAGRKKVVSAVNLTMVHTYFEIGRIIVEHQQHGKARADYGSKTLKELSTKLSERYGKGFSVENLDRMRFFYKVYSRENSSTPLTNSANTTPAPLIADNKVPTAIINYEPSSRNSILSWSHYLVLMRMENNDARRFYEIEASANQWSLSELKRQIDSALYERLALSRDRKKVRQLSQKGQVVEQAQDVIKEPYILEFLGLQDRPAYSETQLESSIIEHLQYFLLELGKGFAFIGRQVRFTFEEKHFKVDLVFYNRLLRCFVVIDLKLGEILHQDLGQIQMYVNYYDRYVKTDGEQPTIGILLCQRKNSSIVELTLPKKSNVYAAEYSLYLPEKKVLERKMAEWVREFERGKGEMGKRLRYV
jgi:predicted nuclease of restriction endonuclease-like (RecB) superfamily